MKKILLILLGLQTFLIAQTPVWMRDDSKKGWAVDLNGTNESMSKSSPVNLSPNGTQRIAAQTDRDFETSIGNWIAVGSATVDTSSTQKHAGSKSLKIVTSGAWSGVQLPYASFTALTADANNILEKYTFQFWVYNQSADSVKVIIGDKSIVRNIGATTWTKFVFNFQITANTINQNIQILFKTTGKTNYIDDVSLTKAYDMLGMAFIKTSYSTETRYILHKYTTITGFNLADYLGGKFYTNCYDGVYSGYVTGTKNIADDVYHLGVFEMNKTGNLTLYTDGAIDGTPTSISDIGDLTESSPLFVGAKGDGNLRFVGEIGEVQITRFTDISQSNVNPTSLYTAYRFGIPKTWIGGSPEVIAHYKFNGTTTAVLLTDWSGNGNNLSGTNVTQAGDQVKGSYPTK